MMKYTFLIYMYFVDNNMKVRIRNTKKLEINALKPIIDNEIDA